MVGPSSHVLSTGANLHIVTSAEHDVMVVPPAHPHAESTHRAAPHTPAPYRPPRLPPRPLAFDKGSQPPTAWSMAFSLSHMDQPHPTAPRHSATPGKHLLSMAAPSDMQATTQQQAAWYEQIYLAHCQDQLSNPSFIAHDHARRSLPPSGYRGWPVPPVITVPVTPTTASLLPTAIGFGASAPPSGQWGGGRVRPASQQPIVVRPFCHGNLRPLQCLHAHDLLHDLPHPDSRRHKVHRQGVRQRGPCGRRIRRSCPGSSPRFHAQYIQRCLQGLDRLQPITRLRHGDAPLHAGHGRAQKQRGQRCPK